MTFTQKNILIDLPTKCWWSMYRSMYNKNTRKMYETQILEFFENVFMRYISKDFEDLTLGIIKPDFHHWSEQMMDDITKKFGFNIEFAADFNIKTVAPFLYAEHKGRPFFPGLVKTMSSGPSKILLLRHEPVEEVVAGEVVKKLCYQLWRDAIGPKNPREGSMDTLRHRYYFLEHGTDFSFYDSGEGTNGFHGSDSLISVLLEAMKILCAMYREVDHIQLAEGITRLIENNTLQPIMLAGEIKRLIENNTRQPISC